MSLEGFKAFNPAELRISQIERLKERRFVFVEEWGMAVPIKKLTAGELIDAANLAKGYNADTGRDEESENRKNIYLVLLGIEGCSLRDYDTMANESAGIVTKLLEKILEFSGFTTDHVVSDFFEEEKKN